jgi:hypothetical protein
MNKWQQIGTMPRDGTEFLGLDARTGEVAIISGIGPDDWNWVCDFWMRAPKKGTSAK